MEKAFSGSAGTRHIVGAAAAEAQGLSDLIGRTQWRPAGGFLIVGRELALVGGVSFPQSIVVGQAVLAFLGQAALGSGLTLGVRGMRGVGWVTVVWNLGLLARFSLTIPDDMYVPLVHSVAPTLIAIALLVRGPGRSAATTGG